MAYCETNYQTKKQLREALKRNETVRVYQPGPFGPNVADGTCYLEGPHYPKPHKWYASVVVQDNQIIKLIS